MMSWQAHLPIRSHDCPRGKKWLNAFNIGPEAEAVCIHPASTAGVIESVPGV
jgi:hypothetical protein